MPHHSIQFFFQTSPDVLFIIILHNEMILQKRYKQLVGYLHVLHFLSLPFRVGCDDGDGVLDIAPTIQIIVTTDTIVTFFQNSVQMDSSSGMGADRRIINLMVIQQPCLIHIQMLGQQIWLHVQL